LGDALHKQEFQWQFCHAFPHFQALRAVTWRYRHSFSKLNQGQVAVSHRISLDYDSYNTPCVSARQGRLPKAVPSNNIMMPKDGLRLIQEHEQKV
jgi:hypothetical protein